MPTIARTARQHHVTPPWITTTYAKRPVWVGWVECQSCGARWEPYLESGSLVRDWWECPQGCNAEA